MNLGGWIIGVIVICAWGFLAWAAHQRGRELDAERRLQQAERDVEDAKTKRFKAKLAARDVA